MWVLRIWYWPSYTLCFLGVYSLDAYWFSIAIVNLAAENNTHLFSCSSVSQKPGLGSTSSTSLGRTGLTSRYRPARALLWRWWWQSANKLIQVVGRIKWLATRAEVPFSLPPACLLILPFPSSKPATAGEDILLVFWIWLSLLQCYFCLRMEKVLCLWGLMWLDFDHPGNPG